LSLVAALLVVMASPGVAQCAISSPFVVGSDTSTQALIDALNGFTSAGCAGEVIFTVANSYVLNGPIGFEVSTGPLRPMRTGVVS
jgi:hypothetical protein